MPFDLREENEEGYFDGNDFYIEKKEQFDPWYESVKDEAKKKEMLAHKRNKDDDDSDKSEENQEKPDVDYSKYGEEDLYYVEEKVTPKELQQIKADIKKHRISLAPLLNDKETVNQALKRLKPKKPPALKNKKMKSQEAKKEEEPSPKDKEKFDKLLDLISKLTELSFFDVYTDTREKIFRAYGENAILEWKYKTIVKGGKDEEKKEEVFSTFTGEQISEWDKKDYFTETPTLEFEFCVENPLNSSKSEWFKKSSELFKKYLN